MNLSVVRTKIEDVFLKDRIFTAFPEDEYSDFFYPKLIKLMRFNTKRFLVDGFGHLMTMHTKTVFGMELLTASFMPSKCPGMPYLLIDIMTVGKKRTVFVEYYDCSKTHPATPLLSEIKEKYDFFDDYEEKGHWYVHERASYSLVKSGTCRDDNELICMIVDSVDAYKKEISVRSSDQNSESLEGLKAFRDRMITEGNPSSAVLEKVFGKAGAENFFKKCVMPLE